MFPAVNLDFFAGDVTGCQAVALLWWQHVRQEPPTASGCPAGGKLSGCCDCCAGPSEACSLWGFYKVLLERGSEAPVGVCILCVHLCVPLVLPSLPFKQHCKTNAELARVKGCMREACLNVFINQKSCIFQRH